MWYYLIADVFYDTWTNYVLIAFYASISFLHTCYRNNQTYAHGYVVPIGRHWPVVRPPSPRFETESPLVSRGSALHLQLPTDVSSL